MSEYTRRFVKQTLVVFAVAILFIAWQTNQYPEGYPFHVILGGCIFMLGLVFNGFMAVLTALEDKEKDKEDKKEGKKEILKG